MAYGTITLVGTVKAGWVKLARKLAATLTTQMERLSAAPAVVGDVVVVSTLFVRSPFFAINSGNI